MPHIQSQTEWEDEMSVKILEFTRNELYLDLRFLNLALSALIPKADATLKALATDGTYIRYSSGRTLRLFQDNPKFLARAYLHSVLHCIFAHLWLAGDRDRKLWGISCDIAVEYTIDSIERPSTKRILTWLRRQTYDKLREDPQGISAAAIYRMLAGLEGRQLALLQEEFYTDDHCYWPGHDTGKSMNQEARNQWNKIARQAQMQQPQSGSGPNDGELLFATQIKAGRSRRSYSDFLKKFSVLREELHCDPDEFDLNFYTYGLRLYGNMPLVEPTETRESKKIQEFVIVVDTSDSTSGELVKSFLRETFQILRQKENFFTKCKIRILQCDDKVRMDQEINDLSQFERLLGQFTVIGGGGTDFCPAFTYVNGLIKQGAFRHLGGLLYFTDGQGTYPKKRPPYKAAFLFLGDYDETKVPPWAMRLRLEPEEFHSYCPRRPLQGLPH